MTETGTPGDVHIWKAGSTPAEAECGYVQETIEHEAITTEDGEGNEVVVNEAWTEVVAIEGTGNVCAACIEVVTPEPPVEVSDEDDDGTGDGE